MSDQREICPKTRKPCAAGCFSLVYGLKSTGYCYEKDTAGDYANPTLVERAQIAGIIKKKLAALGSMGSIHTVARIALRQLIIAIERGDHAQPEPATREGES